MDTNIKNKERKVIQKIQSHVVTLTHEYNEREIFTAKFLLFNCNNRTACLLCVQVLSFQICVSPSGIFLSLFVSLVSDVFTHPERQPVITRKKGLLGPTSCFYHLQLSHAIYIQPDAQIDQREGCMHTKREGEKRSAKQRRKQRQQRENML